MVVTHANYLQIIQPTNNKYIGVCIIRFLSPNLCLFSRDQFVRNEHECATILHHTNTDIQTYRQVYSFTSNFKWWRIPAMWLTTVIN